MEFKELKSKFMTAHSFVLKTHDYYNNSTIRVNKENYVFRCVLNHNSMIDFELIKPNNDYFKIHPYMGMKDVKFTFIIHPWNNTEKKGHEDIKTIERFCEILGWDEHNLNEFKTYLDMYNVKRI